MDFQSLGVGEHGEQVYGTEERAREEQIAFERQVAEVGNLFVLLAVECLRDDGSDALLFFSPFLIFPPFGDGGSDDCDDDGQYAEKESKIGFSCVGCLRIVFHCGLPIAETGRDAVGESCILQIIVAAFECPALDGFGEEGILLQCRFEESFLQLQ